MPSKSPFPQWIPPQLTQLVETAPSGPHWLHEIKLDGFRMSVRIERGQTKLLTRTGLDWSAKYPSLLTALAAVRARTAYLDGELCGVGDDGLPNFAETQAATDGARGVRLVFYAFDLLHLDGRDTTHLPLLERKAQLEPMWPTFMACSLMAMRLATGSLSAAMPASSALRASYRRRRTRPTRRTLRLSEEY
jgi:ATP-dependent DNA ligase